MNPAFIILLLLGAVLLWFLLSFLFVPIGSIFNKMFKDSNRAMHDGGKADFMDENSEQIKGEEHE